MASGQPLPDSVPAALARGASIGRYIVLAMVGRGGMGEVYAAYDPELDRKVAVKLLRVKPGNGVSLAEGRTRTLREAQAIARLSHPNVVVVFDVGTFEDKVFIAMEYVEGNTVTYWLQVQQRAWKEILQVFGDAGRGLAAAHEKGLVHRDFKTDNVMVSRDRHVRVMDFGLARQVQEKSAPGAAPGMTPPAAPPGPKAGQSVVVQPIPIRILSGGSASNDGPPTMVVATDPSAPIPIEGRTSSGMFDARLTRTGAMMGTPAYMAPEQFLGTPTDARSDQFSFCISLYEALYGARPFEGSTMSTLTANVVQGNVRDAPAGSKIPFWVRKVLLRGLMPRAKDRWPSMEALLDALGKDPSVQRKKWLAAAGGMAIIGSIFLGGRALIGDQSQVCSGGPPKLAGIWDLQKRGEPEPARHEQIHRAFLATGKSYAPDVFATVSRALTTYAHNWANMYREACEATEVRREQSAEVMDLRMECLQERLGGLRALAEVFSQADGQVVENATNAANALSSLDRCADVSLLRAVIRPPDDPTTRAKVSELRRRMADAKAQFEAGRWKEMLLQVPRLVDEARTLGYPPLTTESLALLGMMRAKGNTDPRSAETTLTEAFWAADAARHDEVRAEAAAHLVFVVGYQQGRFSDARRWATAAESVLNRMGGHDLLRAWLFNDLGAVVEMEGKKDEALQLHLKAISLKTKVLGERHPDVAITEANLAIALNSVGKNEEALEHLDKAIDIEKEGLGAGHPDLAMQFNNRGEILRLLGRYGEARASLEQARNIWERELGSDNALLAYALTGIGEAFLAEGHANESLVPLARALTIRQTQDPDSARRGETSFAYARALWDSNHDRKRALALAEEARRLYERTPSKEKIDEIDGWLRAVGEQVRLLHLARR
jgi:serine/threonine protein kinase/tetratricopeptide (TPR) repeat protein